MPSGSAPNASAAIISDNAREMLRRVIRKRIRRMVAILSETRKRAYDSPIATVHSELVAQHGLPISAFHPHPCARLFVELLPIVPSLALEPGIRPAGLVSLLALELLITLPAIQFERTVIER